MPSGPPVQFGELSPLNFPFQFVVPVFLRALKTIQEHKELRNSYKGSTNDLVLKFIPGMFLNRLEKIVVLLVSQLPQPETFKAQRLGVQNE